MAGYCPRSFFLRVYRPGRSRGPYAKKKKQRQHSAIIPSPSLNGYYRLKIKRTGGRTISDRKGDSAET